MHRLLARVASVLLVSLAAATAVPAASLVVTLTSGSSASAIVGTLQSNWDIHPYSCNVALGAGDTLVVGISGGIGVREIRYIVPAVTLPQTHLYKITFLLPSELPFRNNTDPGAPPFYILVDLDNTGDVFVPEGSTSFGDFMMVVTTTQSAPISGGGQGSAGGLPALDPLRTALLGAGLLGIGLFYLLRRR